MSPGFHNSIWMVIAALFALAVLAGTSHATVSKDPVSFGSGKVLLLGSTATQARDPTSAALGTRSAKRFQVAYRWKRYRSYYGGLPYYGGISVYKPRIYCPRVYVPKIYYPRIHVPKVYFPKGYRSYRYR